MSAGVIQHTRVGVRSTAIFTFCETGVLRRLGPSTLRVGRNENRIAVSVCVDWELIFRRKADIKTVVCNAPVERSACRF